MNTVKWEEVKRRAEQARMAAGLPVRSEADRAEGQRRIDDEVHAYKLAELRRSRALTQREVADAMGVSGPRVSDVERGRLDVVSISVLRSYVEALGGRLKVIAEFDDATFQVT